MRVFVILSAVILFATAAAPAVAATKAFQKGYDTGHSIGEAHPGSPAARRTFDPPKRGTQAWQRGWKQGAYDRYASWLKGLGDGRRIPSMDEVFSPPARAQAPAPVYRQAAPVYRQAAPVHRGPPSSGMYTVAARPGSLMSWNRFHYERLPSGNYKIRAASGSGHGPNLFATGSIVGADEMQRILDGARR